MVPSQRRSARSLATLAVLLSLVPFGAPSAVARSPIEPVGPEPALTVERPIGAPVATAGPGDRRAAMLRAGSYRPGPTSAALRRSAMVSDWISRPTVSVPEPARRAESRDSASDRSYRGRNHVWIPALGIDRSISFFSCSSNAYPGDRVYRWGCAGSNNVYLFGHAHSVFKPLHDAYVRGRLRKGMKLYYADGRGVVSTYTVRWWRVTAPDRGEFAYARQSRPSLTLQTCVGSRSQYRLIVRLQKSG
jgi:hypothetical protein